MLHKYDDILEELTLEERMDIAYENAFGDLYSGQPLEDLTENLKTDLYKVIRLSFLAGFRAAGGRIPEGSEETFL